MARTRRGKKASGSPTPAGLKRRVAHADNSASDPGSSGFELSELKRLIRLVQRTGIGELEISSGGRTVRISTRGEGSYTAAPMAAPGPAMEGSAASAKS